MGVSALRPPCAASSPGNRSTPPDRPGAGRSGCVPGARAVAVRECSQWFGSETTARQVGHVSLLRLCQYLVGVGEPQHLAEVGSELRSQELGDQVEIL